MRDNVAAMLRIKNEGRWIRRCLERTFMVAKTVVILDDGSDDNTAKEAMASLSTEAMILQAGRDPFRLGFKIEEVPWGWIGRGEIPQGPTELHFLKSPFTKIVRPKERVSEIRDKNTLWNYAKGAVAAEHWLCLDGDEMPSLAFVRDFPKACAYLDDDHDVLTIPFIYLWDSEENQRVDGIYGNGGDGRKLLRFPRMFSIKRCSDQTIFDMRFAWQGTKGGFHCGSIPQEAYRPEPAVRGGMYPHPIVHFGYIDNPLRQRKFVFYNQIDPNNEGEGCYRHIIGEPDQHAPGPVRLEPWRDE